MERKGAFGLQVREKRLILDLTQEELARRVGCAAITVRKIEAGDLRPSKQIAELLAKALGVSFEEQSDFVRRARAVRPDGSRPTPTPQVKQEEIGLDDLTGRAIRGYTLGERIGEGGFGVVYRAVQPLVDREVAVKIILPKFVDSPDFIRRFEAEAQLVARLEHPYIVPLYDYWREPTVAYLVMRLLRGGNIEEKLEGGLPLERVADLVDQVAAALHTAHRVGVVHRDLKPANILLDEDGNAYLADFGIAKSQGNWETQTRAGDFLGSYAYTSPEQLRAEPVSPQADIYSLGVLVYELLAGEQPYEGPTPIDLAQQHLSAPMPSLTEHRSDLPPALDAIIARATAKSPRDRYADVSRLAADLREVATTGSLSGDGGSADLELVNPYKGLRAFGEGDAADFRGREAQVQQLLTRMGEEDDLSRFLAIIGPSGSGKSSIARAGLIPALRRGALPGSENWFILDLTPGSHPLEELVEALQRVALQHIEDPELEMRKSPYGLVRLLEHMLPDDHTELMVLIDQFEEIFTHVTSEDERARFLELLVTSVLDERSRARILVTLRADFIDEPLRYTDFSELLKHRSELVLPLTPDEIEHAIRAPAERVGLIVQPELVAAIVGDVTDQPGALPLMQYALTETFEHRPDGQMTLATYRELGGVRGALARRADDVYAGLSASDQDDARQLFLRLVTLGEGVEDTRRRVPRSELLSVSEDLDAIVDRFAAYRLLTLDHDPATREPTVEVAHEALLREWPRLRDWIHESRDDIRAQRQLGRAAAEWTEADRDESFLLRGARLKQLETWAEDTALALTDMEQEYLDASLDQRKAEAVREAERLGRESRLERTRQTLRRALVGALAVGFLVAAALSVYAFGQRDQALQSADTANQQAQARATAQLEAETARMESEQESQARATAQAETELQRQEALVQASIGLASQAELELQGSFPERAVLLALEALENYPYTWQAERALGNAVIGNHLIWNFVHDASVNSTRWSPDGNYISTASDDGSVRIWSAATGAATLTLEHEGRVFLAEWSPNGDRLLTRSSDGLARVRDVHTGQLVLSVQTTDRFGIIEWSPLGDRFLTNDFNGTTRVWDSRTGRELLEIPEGTACTQAGCPFIEIWSPSGDRLLGNSGSGAIEVWDSTSGVKNLQIATSWPESRFLQWSPDGSKILGFGEDGTAGIWDAASGTLLVTNSVHSGRINSASWSPQSDRVLTTSDDATAKVWSATTGDVISTFDEHPILVLDGAWSSDGNLVATAGFEGEAMVWDPQSGELIERFVGHKAAAYSIQWSDSGEELASTGDDGVVKLWSLSEPNLLFEIPGVAESGWEVAWSPDGSQIARGQNNGTARVFDVSTLEELFVLGGHGNWPVGDIEWSPDGSLMYTVGGWGDGIANVWDASTGELLATFVDPNGWISYSSWSPDGSMIATASLLRGRLDIWEATSGDAVATFEKDILAAVAAKWSPDGTRIGLAGEGGARIVAAETGETLVHLFPEDPSAYGQFLTWSPDGTRLVVHSDDGLSIINEHGDLLVSNGGHGSLVFSMDWFPAGDRIVSFGKKGFVKVWDAFSGAELLSFQMPLTGNSALSPDGSALALAQNPGGPLKVLWVWQSLDELIDYAKECCVYRKITPEERELFGLPAVEAGS